MKNEKEFLASDLLRRNGYGMVGIRLATDNIPEGGDGLDFIEVRRAYVVGMRDNEEAGTSPSSSTSTVLNRMEDGTTIPKGSATSW